MSSPVVIIGESVNVASDARAMVEGVMNGVTSFSHGDAAGAFAALSAVAAAWSPMFSQLSVMASAATLTADFAKLQNAINSGNFDQGVDGALGLIGGIGGLLALSPVPQTKALGIAVSALANAAKEIYKNRGDIAAALDDIYRTLDQPSVYVPVNIIDPQTLIDHGLLDPKTLLPRIDPSKFNPADYPGIKHARIPGFGVKEGASTYFREGITPPRRDPLAIDLDGDGLETVGITATPIVFDHNADGIRTGTGWVRPDDAWLVLDRDGNGSIDTGRELFGVDTLITAADGSQRNAHDGFEALRSLDANADGVFDASDAAYSQVRLWQDLNQDGVSQSNELSSLAARGIQSIALTASTSTVNLGNGNTVTGTAAVTRSNGSTTTAGTVSVAADAGNLTLASNPFYRQFSDAITLTPTAQALPEMGGSGVVRDLREAMSLGTAASQALVSAVQAFAAGSTREAQRAGLDALLTAWAGTEQVADRFALETAGQETRRFTVGGSSDAALQAQLDRSIADGASNESTCGAAWPNRPLKYPSTPRLVRLSIEASIDTR